jgi:hypothetical protein
VISGNDRLALSLKLSQYLKDQRPIWPRHRVASILTDFEWMLQELKRQALPKPAHKMPKKELMDMEVL